MAVERELVKELEELRQKVRVLEDKEAIRDLLGRYSFHADLNRIDAFSELWTEDSSFDIGVPSAQPYQGRDQIKAFMNGPRHQSIVNRCQHLFPESIIKVDGDNATASVYCEITVHWEGGYGIWRCLMRSFVFRRVDGRWLIKEATSRETGDPRCRVIIPEDI